MNYTFVQEYYSKNPEPPDDPGKTIRLFIRAVIIVGCLWAGLILGGSII